jgi:hypothetical protein
LTAVGFSRFRLLLVSREFSLDVLSKLAVKEVVSTLPPSDSSRL